MRGLLGFLSAAILLASAAGQNQLSYEDLHENMRKIVDMAIEQANKDFGDKHIDYDTILSTDKSKQMVHLLLKSTLCEKEASPSVGKHRPNCKFPKKQPWVSCVACGQKLTCVLFREREKIHHNLKCLHLHGSVIMLAQNDGTVIDEKDHGCLGCV